MWVRKSELRSTSILTNQTILFNWDIINIIQFAEQLCIIKKFFSLLVDKNNAHHVHKSNLSFFIPNVFSKDVSKQTKGT